MRVKKVKTEEHAKAATGHNYRQYEVPNADEQAPYPNVELVNHAQREYWELANERIKEVVTRKVRDDAVRAVEIILSGSPEAFERHENGRAVDHSASKWTQDNLNYLKKTFGEKNVVSCTLHQDEKSPHLHAVVIPITADNRLSAKKLFNPATLRGYQTSYAECMQEHGMARGVEYSQAKHQPMKRFYGQQAQDAQQVDKLTKPREYQPVVVANPGRVQLNPQEWATQQSAMVNEQARRQVEDANRQLEVARALALENAAARDQVRVLQKQLHAAEELKQAILAKLQESNQAANELAKRLAGGEPVPAAWLEKGNDLLDTEAQVVKTGRAAIEQHHTQAATAEKKGDYGRVAELRYDVIPQLESQLKSQEEQLSSYAGGRDRITQLDKEEAEKLRERTAHAAAERKLAEEQQRAKEEAERQQAAQARLADIARQQKLDEQRRQQEQVIQLSEKEKVNQREHISQSLETMLKRADLVGMPSLIGLAEDFRIEILNAQNHLVKDAKLSSNAVPDNGGLKFRVVGSSNIFSEEDLLPNGQSLRPQLNSVSTTNLNRVLDKQERGQRPQLDNGLSM